MKNIAIFASGSGTNAENIARYFESHSHIHVKLILSNKPDAYVLERAKKLNISTLTFTKKELYQRDKILSVLEDNKIDLIVLAGFLLLIPTYLIEAYQGKIINIHPALLPNYGGKGMYGDRVHRAVLDNQEQESGITIHYVNEHYDEGNIIFQKKCPVYSDDTPDSLAERIHQLEHEYYPRVIENLLNQE